MGWRSASLKDRTGSVRTKENKKKNNFLDTCNIVKRSALDTESQQTQVRDNKFQQRECSQLVANLDAHREKFQLYSEDNKGLTDSNGCV